ncbi:uncharacterized protein zgc:152951 [Chanos chanos]|uniref:Uncharacterized protein LOC115822380 n=1 Tax=Chanos chanos TaxID=29144 RepID=A0A6J2WE12_CHACN|nr:uncharacterized protein LOC115822380 [Chanos chanos]XP_030642058.1 uncharacterized protein LOC115822380 [Chanos chanos]
MAEVENRLEGQVTVYSVPGCPHCQHAKNTLKKLGLPVCDVNVNQHPDIRGRIKELTGRSTVPQIFFNGVHVGGNDDLQNLAPDELERLIHMVQSQPLPSDALPLPKEDDTDITAKEEGEFKCERDAFADIVEEFKSSGQIGTHWRGLKVYRNSFTGEQLLNWLVKEKGVDTEKAGEIAQGLKDRKHFNCIVGKGLESSTLLRLLEHEPCAALNTGQMAACSPIKASELSELLRNLILKLYSDHLSADGKTVDYKAMSRSPSFEHYCELAVQLQRVELLSLSREEKLAFFINIYNALVIHGNLRIGFPKNVWQRYRFFNYVSYMIGGEVFTLQDIENGVLRGNRKGVAQLLRPFSKSDPRLQVALPDAEPLIHFALNCGAKSCPPIKTYTPEGIDGQLRTAAEAFLENDDGCMVDTEKGEVKLSQIFKWYKADFGGTDETLLNWVLNHMGESPKKSSLQRILSAGNVKVGYIPYDWTNNGTE